MTERLARSIVLLGGISLLLLSRSAIAEPLPVPEAIVLSPASGGPGRFVRARGVAFVGTSITVTADGAKCGVVEVSSACVTFLVPQDAKPGPLDVRFVGVGLDRTARFLVLTKAAAAKVERERLEKEEGKGTDEGPWEPLGPFTTHGTIANVESHGVCTIEGTSLLPERIFLHVSFGSCAAVGSESPLSSQNVVPLGGKWRVVFNLEKTLPAGRYYVLTECEFAKQNAGDVKSLTLSERDALARRHAKQFVQLGTPADVLRERKVREITRLDLLDRARQLDAALDSIETAAALAADGHQTETARATAKAWEDAFARSIDALLLDLNRKHTLAKTAYLRPRDELDVALDRVLRAVLARVKTATTPLDWDLEESR